MRSWIALLWILLSVSFGRCASADPSWHSIGPFGFETTPLYKGTSAGRVSKITFTANGKLLVASASGGLWRNDGDENDASAVKWNPIGAGTLPSGNFGQVASAQGGLLYAGTGEGHFCADCFPGAGVATSSDNGETWAPHGTPVNSDGKPSRFSLALAIDPQNQSHVWIATELGIFESEDGANTWNQRYACNQDPSTIGFCVSSLINDPGERGAIFASDANGIFRILSRSAMTAPLQYILTADQVSNLLGAPANGLNIALATYKNANAFRLYASVSSRLPIVTNKGQFQCTLGLLKWSGSPKTWSSLPQPIDVTSTGYAYEDHQPTCLSWYSNVIAVNQSSDSDGEDIYLGGIDLLHHYGTFNGVGGWTDLTKSFSMHPDIHDVAINSDGSVFVASDGGVDRVDGIKPQSLNNGLAITQFYPGAAVFGSTNAIAAGSQDNGTLVLDSLDQPKYRWHQVLDGDGGFVSVDDLSPPNLAVETQAGGLFFGQASGTGIDATLPVGDAWNPIKLPGPNNFSYWPHASWTMPIKRSKQDSQIIYVGANVLYSNEPGGKVFTDFGASSSEDYNQFQILNNITALATCYSTNDHIIAGWSTGLLRVFFGKTKTLTLENESETQEVASVAFDRNATDVVDAVLVDRDITHDTVDPDITKPVPWKILQYKLHVDGQTGDIIKDGVIDLASRTVSGRPLVIKTISTFTFLGTTAGLFFYDDGTTTGSEPGWYRFGSGLPQVPVVDILYVEETNAGKFTAQVIAVTHGRGMWAISPASNFGPWASAPQSTCTLGGILEKD